MIVWTQTDQGTHDKQWELHLTEKVQLTVKEGISGHGGWVDVEGQTSDVKHGLWAVSGPWNCCIQSTGSPLGYQKLTAPWLLTVVCPWHCWPARALCFWAATSSWRCEAAWTWLCAAVCRQLCATVWPERHAGAQSWLFMNARPRLHAAWTQHGVAVHSWLHAAAQIQPHRSNPGEAPKCWSVIGTLVGTLW